LLRLERVRLQLGNFTLSHVSLKVGQGEYLVLVGPTGTGKTVLLETIAGLHHPCSGQIFLKGMDVTHMPAEKRHLGVVYQDYALFPHLTVFDNIAFGLKLKKKGTREISRTVSKMAQFLDIRTILKRRPRLLSGGERQRVALARALVLDPHMLLLDEPLSALDRLTRDRLRGELKRIHSELGVSILHITHDLSEAFFLADRLIVMKNGAIIQEGNPEAILKRPKDRFVAELLGIENFIPARLGAGGQLFLKGLGPGDPPVFSASPTETEKAICLIVPNWAIQLFPDKNNSDAYLAMFPMTITGLERAQGHMKIHLKHTGGERLRTTLSWREMNELPTNPALGQEIPVGLNRKGIHWVPAN